MKGKVLRICFVAAVALAALASLCLEDTARAQRMALPDWSGVQVVPYENGVTAFFDSRTGTLFLYDSSLTRPILIRQIDELGRPLRRIMN